MSDEAVDPEERFVRRVPLRTSVVVALALIGGCSSNEDDAADVGTPSTTTAISAPSGVVLDEELVELEGVYDARLGVYALDTGTGREIEYRADERFGHASTFKALLCGVVLQQSSIDDLDRTVSFTSDDLVSWSPVTETRIDTGMSIAELCEAAVSYSDNTATNLLLDEIGGPSGLQASLRDNGDDVINTDRYETEMSEAAPGDTRDTSTPRSIGTTLNTFVLGDALPEDKRAMLTEWLVGNTTGADLVRAGVPEGWVVGDKSGNGGYGTRNDIAVAWPPGGDPIVIAVLSSRDEQDADHDDQLIADTAEVVVDALTETPDSP